MLKHLDLFSGIGGFALACQWAGIETIGFVEIDKYCQKVLRKHWPDVPIVEDIRDVEGIKRIVAYADKRGYTPDLREKVSTRRATITNSEPSSRSERGNTLLGELPREYAEPPTILATAGFPCQPFSVAGKRQGEADNRYLWPETIAVIKEIKPKWVLLENVTGIINLALDNVLSDLEGEGYSYETLVIPACAVNAWHRRDRIWIIANDNSIRFNLRRFEGEGIQWQNQTRNEDKPSNQSIANSHGKGLAVRPKPDNRRGIIWQERQAPTQGNWWAVEPELGRVAHGIPNRVDRLKCLGNAIVPQVAYEIIRIIADIENGHG